MARQYSPTQFFRLVPNDLLARFFKDKHGVLLEIDFGMIKKTEVKVIFDAFTALPPDLQAKIEAECQDIDAMSSQGGITALTDEADFHQDQAFPEAISHIEGFQGKAMWAFLQYPDYWAGATLFLHADNVAETLWKKRNDLPRLPADVEPEATHRFEQAISFFFNNKEGRARNCKIEVFRRYNKEYFFAYPEDYAQSGVEWVRNSLSSRARNPAFEIIFVYCQTEGSLDIYAPRNTKHVGDLQRMFANAILGLDELDEFKKDGRVYVLDALAERDFVFVYPPDHSIESVVVCSLRLSLTIGKKRRIIVLADPTQDPKEIYTLMDTLNLSTFHVTQAEIKVTFAPTPQSNKIHKRSFKISSPCWCALRHEGRDLIIRQMLADSGIEPMKLENTSKGSRA